MRGLCACLSLSVNEREGVIERLDQRFPNSLSLSLSLSSTVLMNCETTEHGNSTRYNKKVSKTTLTPPSLNFSTFLSTVVRFLISFLLPLFGLVFATCFENHAASSSLLLDYDRHIWLDPGVAEITPWEEIAFRPGARGYSLPSGQDGV